MKKINNLKTETYKGISINCIKNKNGEVICFENNTPQTSKYIGQGMCKSSALDDIKDQIDSDLNKHSYKEKEMIEIINSISKKYNLKTKKVPSFEKIPSIIIGDKHKITLSQKQVLVNKGLGILGGSTYEFRNSFIIVDYYSPVYKNIVLSKLKNKLDEYIKNIKK